MKRNTIPVQFNANVQCKQNYKGQSSPYTLQSTTEAYVLRLVTNTNREIRSKRGLQNRTKTWGWDGLSHEVSPSNSSFNTHQYHMQVSWGGEQSFFSPFSFCFEPFSSRCLIQKFTFNPLFCSITAQIYLSVCASLSLSLSVLKVVQELMTSIIQCSCSQID